ncbi:MAG: hypothetical protein AAB581_01695 [Patescibacteria group bacterium]
MKFNLSILHTAVTASLGFAHRHFGIVFFALFLCVLGSAGYVFFHYGYRTIATEPVVSVPEVHVKQKELNDIIRFLDEKTRMRAQVSGKTFHNPFTEPPLDNIQSN